MLRNRCVGLLALLGVLTGCTRLHAEAARSADEALLLKAQIASDGPSLLEFFRKRTVPIDDWQRMRVLVTQLGDRSFHKREQASAELPAPALSPCRCSNRRYAAPILRLSAGAEECLRMIEQKNVGPTPTAAAARMLAVKRPPGTTRVLLDFLPFADDEMVAEEVRNTLFTLARSQPRADVAATIVLGDPLIAAATVALWESPQELLRNALHDGAPARRAAAADALIRADAEKSLPLVQKLLDDPDPSVRLRVASALAVARQPEAIQVLIDLLTELPLGQARQAEYLLCALADGQPPPFSLVPNPEQRARCRDAWAGWWRTHRQTADLGKLKTAPPLFGYTLVVLLDEGRVLELDADDRPRWQIDGLDKPLDAQALGEDRVLLAENGENRVTERNRKGQILWEKKVDGPIVAQRLANGNTFVATQTQLLEFDASGNKVMEQPPPNGEFLMRASMLPNRDIVCVTTKSLSPMQTATFLRIDSTGNRAPDSFTVHVKTIGGRLDVLPNGHVLIPELDHNRVVQYDPTGKIAWKVEVAKPIAAVRLPNGNTLVTSMSENRAVEFDRSGKEQVWEYRADTRVTRAFRR